MMVLNRVMPLAAGLLLFAIGCTPGAESASSGAVPAGAPSSVVTIDVNLTLNPMVTLAAGTSGGFAPPTTTVPLGSGVRFMNSDGFAHTASALGSSISTFPAGSPLGSGALQQFGGTLSQGWSSGSLAAGVVSQTLLADQAGTYLYGCFYHYGAPMRAEIVVR